MGDALTLGIGMGALTGLTSFASAERQRKQAYAQAAGLEQQAKVTQMQGDLAAKQIEQQKSRLRQQYDAAMAKNRSMLAASGIDMSSGSAADVAEGNAISFGSDLAENSYNKALKEWETQTTVNNQKAQASWLRQTSGNMLNSLLIAGLNGAATGISMYHTAGGILNNGKALSETLNEGVKGNAHGLQNWSTLQTRKNLFSFR